MAADNIFSAVMDAMGVADDLLSNAKLSATDRHKVTCIRAALNSWKDVAFSLRGYTTQKPTTTGKA